MSTYILSSTSTNDFPPPSDYNNSTSDFKNSYLARPTSCSRDVEKFSWWKNKFYCHIIGIDEELRYN